MPLSLASDIAQHLPYLRRYARALTGTQHSGDAFVHATLEAIVADPESFPRNQDPRVTFYSVFQKIWGSAGIDVDAGDSEVLGGFEKVTRARLSALMPRSRQALLLTAMEGFSNSDTARIMGTDAGEVAALVDEAMAEIDRQTATSVLIIEDEPIIAMDIESIVVAQGHSVAGIAVTHSEAVAMARDLRPGLVLADIQLADDSSGIDAVREILSEVEVPVIFITAFPERLLTGERPEPTYLITKPFQHGTVKAAMAQALFFNSTAAFA